MLALAYVTLTITKDNHLLLLQRSTARFYTNYYGLVSGKVERNETPTQAAIREAHEEIGIVIKPQDIACIGIIYEKISPEKQLVGCSFLVHAWSGEAYNKEPEVHGQMVWAPLSKLPENIVPSHAHILEMQDKKIFYSEFGW